MRRAEAAEPAEGGGGAEPAEPAEPVEAEPKSAFPWGQRGWAVQRGRPCAPAPRRKRPKIKHVGLAEQYRDVEAGDDLGAAGGRAVDDDEYDSCPGSVVRCKMHCTS